MSAPASSDCAGRVARAGQWSFATPLAIIGALEVSDAADQTTISATVEIDAADPHLRSHFPGFEIFPGVFVLEALRQAVALVFAPAAAPAMAAVRSLRFLAPLRPGDRMHLHAALTRLPGERWLADALARRDDGILAARLKVEFGPADDARGDDRHAGWRLPHAHPMLLIDRVVALEPGRSITALKAITCTEPCYRALAGDLPSSSRAYPTALLLESFGQAAAILWLGHASAAAGVIMLATVRDCRIDGHAYPGDVLRHVVTLDDVVGDNVIVTGATWVGEQRIATIASMMAAVRPPAGLGARDAQPANAPA